AAGGDCRAVAAVAADAGGMIRGQPEDRNGAAQFAARLTEKARRLAEAQIAARAHGVRRWRLAPWLWPQVAKAPGRWKPTCSMRGTPGCALRRRWSGSTS